jgi:DNA-binding MarR family transcriptional regulator
MALQQELGMRQGFAEREHEAALNVYFTASILRKRATEFFRERDLTDVQFNVLSLLHSQSGEEGGLNQVDLSRMMLVNRANITTLIDRMEQAKLVKRVPVAEDRRYNLVVLTAHGRKRHDEVVADYRAETRRIMQVLSAEELDDLMEKLERIRKAV